MLPASWPRPEDSGSVPEGDTVWRTAQLLDRALTGQLLTKTDFRVPEHATADLAGETVTGTFARGKHLFTRIGESHTLHTHLKMEGSWKVYRPGERWRRPAHTARVVLTSDEHQAVGFSLGIVELLPRAQESEPVDHLGPDLLGPDWDEAEAVRRLLAAPDRPVGEALLDQRNLAGIGNLYKSELCFIAGVLPTRPVGEVPELTRLVRRAKAMLEANKIRWEQTTTGNLRPRERTWVYRREREACRRCGTRIEVDLQGEAGRERASYWCPACQR
jgi:endonuclease-8